MHIKAILVAALAYIVCPGCVSGVQQPTRASEQGAPSTLPITRADKNDYIARQIQMLKENLHGSEVLINSQEWQTVLEMPLQSVFLQNSADLNPSFYYALNTIAKILAVFQDTQVIVLVPSNIVWNGDNNAVPINARAQNIKQFLVGRRVSINRISVKDVSDYQSMRAYSTHTNPTQKHHLQMVLIYP